MGHRWHGTRSRRFQVVHHVMTGNGGSRQPNPVPSVTRTASGGGKRRVVRFVSHHCGRQLWKAAGRAAPLPKLRVEFGLCAGHKYVRRWIDAVKAWSSQARARATRTLLPLVARRLSPKRKKKHAPLDSKTDSSRYSHAGLP